MRANSIVERGLHWLRTDPYKLLDRIYVARDRRHVLRTKNIRLIPFEDNRRGGKYSYAEWAHVIGIFQTLMYIHLDEKENNAILDVGCGTGLLAIACQPFIGESGRYVGIDVRLNDIEFCREHYPSEKFSFLHLDVNNSHYNPLNDDQKVRWNVESGRFNLVTALSVWTHLTERDALFYFQEVDRVLSPGGKAMITFFLLDDTYEKGLSKRTDQPGRFHMTRQSQWRFDQKAYGSNLWFCPAWAQVPEQAIGLKLEALDQLVSKTNLRLIQHYPGNWKEVPGAFFQDVMIFQKSAD